MTDAYNANIDPEVASALQNLIATEERVDKSLYDEFRIGLSPYGRGPCGISGYITQGQAYLQVCDIRDRLYTKVDQLRALRADALRERTLEICNALSNFDK